MCWSKKGSRLKIKTAKKDIKVFKIMHPDNNNESYFRFFKWEIGRTEYEAMTFDESNIRRAYNTIDINFGFHSYSDDKCGYKIYEPGQIAICPNCGTYSSLNLMYAIIPKGTRYVINKYGEIVSEYLVPTSFERISKNKVRVNIFKRWLNKLFN